jgi:23S rRNA pseudouridine2605 synthase
MEERLQKIIARAGIASRRHAEDLIRSGMVTVNGRTVTELGSKADEATDHIKVSGKLLRPEHDRVYLVLNKPPEVVSTMSDPEGRRSLQDLLHGVPVRVFPVGRLEYHSMGLVFLTNDGELANRMLKAHRLRQTYLLKLKSLLTFQEIEQLTRATGARITRVRGKESPWYEVTLTEARRDALRNRLFQTGHPVEKIKRIRVGNLELASLQPGGHRTLSSEEVAALLRAIEGKLEPASEPPIKRTQVKRPAKSAATRRGGEKRREHESERRPGSNGKRQGRTELTKRLRTKPRKAR